MSLWNGWNLSFIEEKSWILLSGVMPYCRKNIFEQLLNLWLKSRLENRTRLEMQVMLGTEMSASCRLCFLPHAHTCKQSRRIVEIFSPELHESHRGTGTVAVVDTVLQL